MSAAAPKTARVALWRACAPSRITSRLRSVRSPRLWALNARSHSAPSNIAYRPTMLLAFFATFFASATALLSIFTRDILRVGAHGYGLLSAAPSVGAVLTSAALVPLAAVLKAPQDYSSSAANRPSGRASC